jgi:hypothetical protein
VVDVNNDLGTYVTVLVLGVLSALLVGQVLLRTGQTMLEDAFTERRTAKSVNRMLAMLFHLGALGVLAVISTVDVPVSGAVQTVVTKLGIILLILGVAHGLLILMLNRIRNRSREQRALDRMGAQFDMTQRRSPGDPVVPQAPVVGPSVPR